MAFTFSILDRDVSLELAPILFASLAQQAVGFVWYGILFSSMYCYFYAVDKGVKRAEYAIRRYGLTFQMAVSVLSNVVRTVIIATLLVLLGKAGSSLVSYLEVGAIVGVASLIPLASDFWADRPLPLIFINGGSNIVLSVSAAAVLFLTRDVSWSGGDL